MKTDTLLKGSLVNVLEELSVKSKSFDEVVSELFSFGYSDFNQLFGIDALKVENETYRRIPVFSADHCVAILMVWGIDNSTAIHDHNNYDGRIKILKGNLTEVSYRENSNFIEYDGVGTAHEDDIFPEEYGGIHSIVNNSDEISVSLHIYRTSQLNLDGVRIFDTETRKVAWLNEKATSCSWHLPADCYRKIEKI